MASKYSVFIPIHGLTIHPSIGGEVQIGRVTFVNAKKIHRVRKRLGIPEVVSFYDKSYKALGGVFKVADTYACIRVTRIDSEKGLQIERKLVQKAIWLLASSMFARCDRGRFEITMRPMSDNRLFESGVLFRSGTKSAMLSHERMAPIAPYTYGREELEYMKSHFFPHLLRVVGGTTNITGKWKYQIETAAVLAGRSYLSRTISDAFICTMIAIETLLSKQGDKHRVVLVDRINALFSWVSHEGSSDWSEEVIRLYRLRCGYVHDGERGTLDGLDLFNAETLLANLLRNICINPSHFYSKESIVEFAELVHARNRLGLSPYKKSDRIWFSNRILSAKKREEVREAKWSWE